MATIKNVHPLSAEKLFDLLKTGFTDYSNMKLKPNLAINYTHVFNDINVSFPEVIEGPALNIFVSDVKLTVTLLAIGFDDNLNYCRLLAGFLEEQASWVISRW